MTEMLTSVEQLEIEPGTEQCYARDADSYIRDALVICNEWSREKDPHGYCHERSILVGLLREIERLRGGAS